MDKYRNLFCCFFVACGFAIFSDCVSAQYPTDEIIDPYPKTIKERILVKRFECNDNELPRWNALHDSKLISAESGIQIESSGSDPYVLLPEFPASESGGFEFRIRMKNGSNPQAEIFWATQAQPNFNGENAVRFGFFKDLNRTETYSVIFETNSPLTRLRFDPGTSVGLCEIEFVELYKIVYDEKKKKHTPWYHSNWADNVESWETISAGNIEIRFDKKGIGAKIFVDREHVGDIYPLAHFNPALPLGGTASIPVHRIEDKTNRISLPDRFSPAFKQSNRSISFNSIESHNTPVRQLRFSVDENGIQFEGQSAGEAFYGPVFRPKGEMMQAVLNGVEYLEKGEHSSSTADLETAEHLRFAPKTLDITWPFMSIVTDKIGFGLLWDNPPQSLEAQAVFATPDFIFGDPNSHYMGLYGNRFAGTLRIKKNNNRTASEQLTDLEELILWAIQKHGLPELPKRFRDDEQQRLLNLAAFEKSLAAGPTGWQHAATPGVEKQLFPMIYGNDFVSTIWQLSGKLPNVPRLNHGGGHLRNPASFFLMGKTNEFIDWTQNESKHYLSRQKDNGSFQYAGKYLKGHWESTASGHCGNALYHLMYNYRIRGNETILPFVRKGLDFANKYLTPRGAQVWELSLHTPDIMGSSRMSMANLWYYEATGEKKYLDAARRWAVTGLPFVYFWTSQSIEAKADEATETIMKYATIPVFGATNWTAPNWIGLPVQWCGLDYGEALFMLSEHDKTFPWKKIATGILIAAEQMQYPNGICVGLLPDSFVLADQRRAPHDINPSVLVMQRRRLAGEVESVDIAVSRDKKFRVVSPFRTAIETDDKGNSVAVIEAKKGTTYQILVNGSRIESIDSTGTDRITLKTEKKDD